MLVATSPGDVRPARARPAPRDRLVTRLAATRDVPVVLVVAPSGYGKTTALVGWTEQDDRPTAWLTLSERHNDPALMLGAIGARMADVLGGRRQPFVLVLDDFDRIDDPRAIEPLTTIAGSIPAGSQLVIATSSEPALPLGRMRADRQIAEFGPDELRMTVAEASRALAASELQLGPESVKRLVERTEGWPAGLFLAALSLAGKDDVEAAVANFHGDDRLVADYVRDEFLSGLDQDTLDFLFKTSILDRLSGELCDFVLERRGSAELLHGLVRSNALIVPLDGRDRSYRYHALLREMLRSELLRVEAPVESRLHLRASEWYRERGEVDNAVAHVIQAGDSTAAGKLIWANAADYESSGRHATVRGWLAGFTDEQQAASPPLCLARATWHLTEGDGTGVERWTSLALQRLEGSESPADGGLAVVARVIRACGAAREGVVSMREEVQAAYPSLPGDSPWRSICRLVEGAALHLSGDAEGARRALEDGARIGTSTTPSIQSLCRAQLALLSLDDGDMGEAERQAALALAETDRHGLGDYPTQALIFAASALVRARRGRSEAAITDVKTAVRLLSGLTELSPWYEAEVRITVARALLLLDDVLAARSHLAEAGRFLRDVGDAKVLRAWLDGALAEVEATSSVGGRWPLTPAELRLLHALPTHFSFREIGDRQFVSPNTVKTQAQAIYRKLGVSSRAEAVAVARAAGLLGNEPEDSPERGDAQALKPA